VAVAASMSCCAAAVSVLLNLGLNSAASLPAGEALLACVAIDAPNTSRAPLAAWPKLLFCAAAESKNCWPACAALARPSTTTAATDMQSTGHFRTVIASDSDKGQLCVSVRKVAAIVIITTEP
jgi:hypothetical protein